MTDPIVREVSVAIPLALLVLWAAASWVVLGRRPRSYGSFCLLGSLATLLAFASFFYIVAPSSSLLWCVVAAVSPASFVMSMAIAQALQMQSYQRALAGTATLPQGPLHAPRQVRTGVKVRVGTGWEANLVPAGPVDDALSIRALAVVITLGVTFVCMWVSMILATGQAVITAPHLVTAIASGVALLPLAGGRRVVIAGILPAQGHRLIVQTVSPFRPRLIELGTLDNPAFQYMFRGRRCYLLAGLDDTRDSLLVVTDLRGSDPSTPTCTAGQWHRMVWLGVVPSSTTG